MVKYPKFILASLGILLVSGILIFLNLDTGSSEGDLSVSTFLDAAQETILYPQIGISTDITTVEPAQDFTLDVAARIPSALQGDLDINVAEIIISFPKELFDVNSVSPAEGVLIAGENISNEEGIVSFDVSKDTPINDGVILARLDVTAKVGVAGETSGLFSLGEGSTLGFPNRLEGIQPAVRIELASQGDKLFGETCTTAADCKGSNIWDDEPVCNSNFECANPKCPDSTIQGRNGECSVANQGLGEPCETNGFPGCSSEFVCAYNSKDACTTEGAQPVCIPYGSGVNSPSSITSYTYQGGAFVAVSCPQEPSNLYAFAVREPNKLFSTQELQEIYDRGTSSLVGEGDPQQVTGQQSTSVNNLSGNTNCSVACENGSYFVDPNPPHPTCGEWAIEACSTKNSTIKADIAPIVEPTVIPPKPPAPAEDVPNQSTNDNTSTSDFDNGTNCSVVCENGRMYSDPNPFHTTCEAWSLEACSLTGSTPVASGSTSDFSVRTQTPEQSNSTTQTGNTNCNTQCSNGVSFSDPNPPHNTCKEWAYAACNRVSAKPISVSVNNSSTQERENPVPPIPPVTTRTISDTTQATCQAKPECGPNAYLISRWPAVSPDASNQSVGMLCPFYTCVPKTPPTPEGNNDQACPPITSCGPTSRTVVSVGLDGCQTASCEPRVECTPLPSCYYDPVDPCVLPQDANFCPAIEQPVSFPQEPGEVTEETGQVCNLNTNGNNKIDIDDFTFFAQNYKKDSLADCSKDIVGNDCRYDIADFQLVGRYYENEGICEEIITGEVNPYQELYDFVTENDKVYVELTLVATPLEDRLRGLSFRTSDQQSYYMMRNQALYNFQREIDTKISGFKSNGLIDNEKHKITRLNDNVTVQVVVSDTSQLDRLIESYSVSDIQPAGPFRTSPAPIPYFF
jgi:hypothetical protein